ncbi:MAG: TonB-dependent receptor [Desulfococcaceae bacterium]
MSARIFTNRCFPFRLTLLIALLLAFLPELGHAADETAGGERIETRRIVVTPTRTERELQEVPSSVSMVSEEELKRTDAATVADALRDVPGVEVFDQSIPGAKRVKIRGESGSRVLVLIDGQKISEQKSMDGAALLIDPNRIGQIEVIKGPASVLYGSEAIGGVVNIITKKGGDRPVQPETNLSYDTSADGVVGYASVFGGYRGFQYRLSGSWTDYDDRRTADGKLENSAYENQDYAVYLGYDKENLSFGATYDEYRSDIESHTPEGTTSDTLTYFQIDLPEWDRQKLSGFAEVRAVSGSIPRIRFDGYYQNTQKSLKNDMDLNIPVGPMGFMRVENRMTTENDQDTFGGNLQFDWMPHDSHYLIFGYEPIFDRLEASTETRSFRDSPMPPPMGSQTASVDTFTYEAENDAHALYLQDEWYLPADFTATLGFRQTWVHSELTDTNNPEIETRDTDDSQPVFSAGLTYAGIDNTVLRALFSQGYRFPNLQQLFIGTVHGGAEPTFPDPDLDPETSDNYEIGARFDNRAFAFDVAAFLSDAEDYITTAPVDGGRQFTNADSAETLGIEFTLSCTVPEIGLTPYASGTWMRREFTRGDFTTDDTGQPDFYGRLGVRYERRFEAYGAEFFSDLYARGATEADESFSDGTSITYGSWETLNWTLGARFGEKRSCFATLALNNLFDRSYATAASSLDEPGFHAVFKAGVSF